MPRVSILIERLRPSMLLADATAMAENMQPGDCGRSKLISRVRFAASPKKKSEIEASLTSATSATPPIKQRIYTRAASVRALVLKMVGILKRMTKLRTVSTPKLRLFGHILTSSIEGIHLLRHRTQMNYNPLTGVHSCSTYVLVQEL